MKVPGLSFSWKRALGVTKLKREVARKTCIPTSRAGMERKVGSIIVNAVLGKKK